MHEANSDDTHQVLVAVVVVLAMVRNLAHGIRIIQIH